MRPLRDYLGEGLKLEDLKRLCDEATPGPWPNNGKPWQVDHLTGFADLGPVHVNDCAFIAAARTYMPKLLAVAEAAKAHLWSQDHMIFNDDQLREALAALEAE